MRVLEHPLFDPWAPPPDELEAPVQEPDEPGVAPDESELEAVDRLRALATPRFHAVSQRLRLARHETALEDRLDEPSRLLRFEVSPWGGPFRAARRRASAMLEIGLAHGSDDVVTAWYWLDRTSEAPQRTTSVAGDRLSATWIEQVILDFVGKALARD